MFIEGQQHGFPLGIRLTETCLCSMSNKQRLLPPPSFLCVISHTYTLTHITRGVHHGFTPGHRLPGAGSHCLRPAVVELASHRRLITTSWPEREKRRHSVSFTSQTSNISKDTVKKVHTLCAFCSRPTALLVEQTCLDAASSV